MSQSQKNNFSEDEEEAMGSQYSESSMDNPNIQAQVHQKLLIQKEQNDNRCATYVFHNQDHTLGNALRFILSGHADVEFVGYSIPHPSQAKMNLRLQTLTEDSNIILNQGLKTIQSIAKNVRSKFVASLQNCKKIKHKQ